jgi:hypothetical protein
MLRRLNAALFINIVNSTSIVTAMLLLPCHLWCCRASAMPPYAVPPAISEGRHPGLNPGSKPLEN